MKQNPKKELEREQRLTIYENSQNYEKCIACITKGAIKGVTRSK